MEKELISELNKLKDEVEELLDRANTVASDFVLIEDEKLEKLEEQKLYKLLDSEFIEFKNEIEEVQNNFNFENAFNLYKIFSEKVEFITSDISMAEAISEGNIEDELFVYNYIKIAFCLKDLDLMLENFDILTNKLSKII